MWTLLAAAAVIGGIPPVVTVTARDHAFEAPDTISSGAVTFRLRDLGPTSHHLIVFRLDDSVSMREFYDAMRPGVVTPPGISSLGGPESDEEVTLFLRPGKYALGCLKDFTDGTTHLGRGMFRALTVVRGKGTEEPAPRADVTVTMRNYTFEFSGPLKAGRRILRLENAGPQEHHILLQRLEPGKTLADVERWIAGGRKRPRPLSPVFFGTSRQSRGETVYVAIDLTPGVYLIICRIPDAGDGRPHIEHGMRAEFHVESALPGNVVDVAAGEFFFQAPDSIPAGLTTFRLRQTGLVHHRASAGGPARDSMTADRGDQTRGFHMLWVVRLDDGKSVSDFYEAMRAGEPAPWAHKLGGPGFVIPPGTANATLALAPGNYVLACFVGSARADRSRSHLLNGMFRAMTVVPSRAPAAHMPEPDVVAQVSAGGNLSFSGPITAGERIVRVDNAGAKGYEFVVRRVLPGSTAAEAIAWRRDRSTGAQPFELIGGISDVPPGGSVTTTIAFAPGEHVVGSTVRVGFTVLPDP